MKKHELSTVLLITLLLLPVFCKGSLMGNDIYADSTKNAKQASVHSGYFGTGYGDNLVLGSSISKPQSFLYGSLSYGFKNEFFLSGSSFYLPGFNDFPAYNALSANYSHAFNTWFDISISASGFITNKKLVDTLFSNFLFGDISMGFDWKVAYTRITASRVLSGAGSSFFQVKNSRYFQTPEFFSGKMYISFDPYVNLLFGSLTRITTSEGTTIGVNSPVWTGGSGSGSGGGSGNGSGSGSSSGSVSPVTSTSIFFGLMETDLGIPIGLNIGKLTIEAEPGYIFPLFTDPSIPSPEGFTMMFNCYFRIF
jgi:hypothetical protein